MKKLVARIILYIGLAILLFLGYLFPNSYDIIFRLTGIVITAVGALLFLTFSKVRRGRQ